MAVRTILKRLSSPDPRMVAMVLAVSENLWARNPGVVAAAFADQSNAIIEALEAIVATHVRGYLIRH